jgi:carbon starvation protein
MLLTFILFTLIYVIIVFLDLTAVSFAPAVRLAGLSGAAADAARDELARGGAVATSSLTYIALAVLFGVSVYRFRVPLWAASLVFVPLVFAGLWLGQAAPLAADHVPVVLGSAKNFWTLTLLFYCGVASVLPVWVLLQPRDYLSSFLLYACVLGGAIGLVAAGSRSDIALNYPYFIGWRDAQLGFLFPALFVTIACGAISGFHSMVASGTTARQARTESSARVVGYGGMLVEGVLALLALASVMVLSQRTSAQPVAVFADGMGRFLNAIGVPSEIARTFGMLAVSTFLLTTLDTCTRLCRFVVQELFGLDGSLWNRLWTTLAVLALPAAVAFRQIAGPGGAPMPVWRAIWPAFGATNQLMAALALLVVFAWLRAQGRRTIFVVVPMVFMFVTTITALVQLAWLNLRTGGSALVGGLSLALAVLAVYVAAAAAWTLLGSRGVKSPPAL